MSDLGEVICWGRLHRVSASVEDAQPVPGLHPTDEIAGVSCVKITHAMWQGFELILSYSQVDKVGESADRVRQFN